MESGFPSKSLLGEARINVENGSALGRSQNFSSSRADRDCSATCELVDAPEGGLEVAEREQVRRKLMFAMALCFAFMLLEVVGGILSNSLAIMTDAAHLLSDVAGFAISLFALWMSSWEATPTHTFGYHRMEILGALVSMQFIWMITGILVYEAIIRMLSEGHEVDGKLMFITAAFGVAVNILMTALLGHHHSHGPGGHDHDHGHGHGHSHGSHGHGNHSHGNAKLAGSPAGHSHRHATSSKLHSPSSYGNGDVFRSSSVGAADEEAGLGHTHSHEGVACASTLLLAREGSAHSAQSTPSRSHELIPDTPVTTENINLRGAYLHVLGDLIQSVGVMIGGAIIWWKPEWKIVDLICTLLFSVLVLFTTFKMLRDIMEVLMESTPREINATELEEGIRQLEGVVDVHELHIWAITKGKVVLACHVRAAQTRDTDEVLNSVLEFCEREYGISHATVQVERDCEQRQD